MTDRTANDSVDSRSRMMLPLLIFGVACFLFAGAVKFHVKGGDIWFVRPMGAPVTCLLIGFVAFVAARWFFGARPRAVPLKLLAALVVLLPLMGLFGVVQAASQPAESDSTPLGGSLGAMLAGPRAFGSLGTTVSGILFAILALFGGYLARRITVSKVPEARRDDPYALMKAMSTKRLVTAPVESTGTALIGDDDEGVAEGDVDERGGLFPVDAELEPEAPETVTITEVRPMATMYSDDDDDETIAVADEVEETPEPVRAPLLSGLVFAETQDDDDSDDVVMPIFRTSYSESENGADASVPMALSLDVADDDEAMPAWAERTGTTLAPPVVEPDEDSGSDLDDDVTIDDGEVEASAGTEPVAADVGGEAPDLKPEWLAAPDEFHMPRRMENEMAGGGSLFDILDVEDKTPDAPTAPPPRVERPRFRVKAEYVQDVPPEAVEQTQMNFALNEAPAVEMAHDVVDEAPSVEVVRLEDDAALPVAEAGPAAFGAGVFDEAPEAPVAAAPEETTPRDDQQLEFPVEGAAPTTSDEDADSTKPRRRMRSAKKDWASWDEAPGKDRPRLRLVRADESELTQTEIVADMPAGQADDGYDRAVALVVLEDRCSVSLLQRHLGVTFGEATALIDLMYQQGVVGPYQPTGRRDVLIGKKGAAAEEG